MNGSRLLIVSAVVMAAAALAGCDSGPSAPKSEVPAPQGKPAATASPSPSASSPSAMPRDFAAAGELKDVHFDLDQARIRPAAAKILDSNARWLKSRKDMVVLIGGHADERGSDEYNARLGERRADEVKKHLVAQGIEANRIMTTSHGERQPLCAAHNEGCWGKNRRVDFQVKPR